ncbi:MAG: GNAT family N-acetyltransferase [Candidatus Fimenecus sp.]
MVLRQYTPADCAEILQLFYDTVHTVNAKDYTKEQLDAWATKNPDAARWNASLSANYTLVVDESGKIVGFGDIDNSGSLDHLFVHKDFQCQGIATALCEALECAYGDTLSVICTQASVTAKPFFEQRGYRVMNAQKVERHGVFLENFLMKKIRK